MKCKYSFSQLWDATLGAIMLTTISVGLFFILALMNYGYREYTDFAERIAPADDYYRYVGVNPTKGEFLKGEDTYMQSELYRFKDINVRREDTLYCSDGTKTTKYPTQYRPPDGYEYKVAEGGLITSSRQYGYQIKPKEIECHMKGVVIGVTSRGHQKIWSYKTDNFFVNR